MTEGLSAVQARISELQAFAPPVGGLGSSGAAAASGAGGSIGFADALAQALQQAGATGTGTPSQATSGALGQQAVDVGSRYLGVPYRWGGTDPKTGLDCSGYTQLVYRQLGIDLPRTSRAQATVGTEVPSLDQARPGDLLFFGSPVDHVGIYAGHGKMLEAPHTGAAVRLHKVWATPTHIRRVIDDSATAPVTSSPGVAQALATLAGTGTGQDGLGLDGVGSGLGLDGVGLDGVGLDGVGNGLGLDGLAGLGTLGASTGLPTVTGQATNSLGTPFDAVFATAGAKYGVDPALLAAVARAESGYDPNATSRAGAQGLMQLMPSVARSLGVDPLNPAQAVDGAARLLSGYLRDYGGRTDLALAAYNAGPGAVRRYGGVPPYAETRSYIHRVTGYREALR